MYLIIQSIRTSTGLSLLGRFNYRLEIFKSACMPRKGLGVLTMYAKDQATYIL